MQSFGAQIADSISDLSSEIELHTIQFFSNSNPGDQNHKPESLGSGVLIKHGEKHYIATAAHVLGNTEGDHIGVYTRKKDFFEIGTTCKSDPELIDVGVWYVEPDLAADMAPEDWWYPIEESVSHHTEVDEEKYLIYGFPATKSSIDLDTKEIHQNPFKYLTRGYSSTPQAKKANVNEEISFLLEFHKDKIRDVRTNRREHAPQPYGMSGCGLWYFDGIKFRLVGIMTEWRQPIDKLPALKATKIEFVLGAILHLESILNKDFSSLNHTI